MYANAGPEIGMEMQPQGAASYGKIDYSAFSQPPEIAKNYTAPDFVKNNQYNYNYNAGNDMYGMSSQMQAPSNTSGEFTSFFVILWILYQPNECNYSYTLL